MPPHPSSTSVLVADDQPHVVEALRLLLKLHGYDVQTADSPRTVLAQLDERSYDVLLLDLNYARDTTSGGEGLDLIGRIRGRDVITPIVVMTAWGGVTLAVSAMQRGACDFVVKPWDNDRLLAILRTQTELGRASRRAAQLEATLQHDLQLASQVQAQLFPRTRPPLASLDYCGRCRAARVVGGDYFDFISLQPGRLGLALGDVAGKGVSAALMMATLQALVRSRIHAAAGDPAALLADVNTLLLESIPSNRFATFFYGAYDDRERTLAYVNAGHNAPLVRRVDGTIERLESGDPVLGLMPHLAFHARTMTLDRGDTLVVFSDGLVDAECDEGAEFGEERVIEILNAVASCGTADDVLDAITAAHERFVNGAPPQDDVTIVVARGV